MRVSIPLSDRRYVSRFKLRLLGWVVFWVETCHEYFNTSFSQGNAMCAYIMKPIKIFWHLHSTFRATRQFLCAVTAITAVGDRRTITAFLWRVICKSTCTVVTFSESLIFVKQQSQSINRSCFRLRFHRASRHGRYRYCAET